MNFHETTSNLKVLSASKFYGEKITAYKSSAKKGNPDLKIRHKKPHEVQQANQVFPSLIDMKLQLMVVAG